MITIPTDYLPDYTSWESGRIGSFSRTNDDDKCKYILTQHGITIGEKLETPPYWVSQDLSQCRFAKTTTEHISIPLYAKRCSIPQAVYVDIKHAYLQIARVVGAETVIHKGSLGAIGAYTFNNAIYREYKICRAMIMSCTVERMTSQIWHNKELKSITFTNRNYAPHLQYAIKATLQSVALECLPLIAYWHTDGMIVPLFSLSKVEDILKSWHLEYSIKSSGSTRINGIGNYTVGDLTTRGKTHANTSNIVQVPKWKEGYLRALSLR